MTIPPSDSDGLLEGARDLATQAAWKELLTALAGREPAIAGEPELAVLRAEAELRLGNLREARAWLEYAVPQLDRVGNGTLLRRAVNMLGAARFEAGDLDAAEESFERVVLLAAAEQADLDLARATNNMGLIANIRGRPGEALALYRLTIPAFQRVGMLRELSEAFHNMAISYRDLRQLEEAERHERRAIEFAHQAGSAQVLAMARVGRAELSLLRGELLVAEAVAGLAAIQYQEMDDPVGQADALRLAGTARTRRGAAADALQSLERAVALAREHGSALIEAEALGARAECLEALGEPVRARADAEAALDIYDRMGANTAREALEKRQA